MVTVSVQLDANPTSGDLCYFLRRHDVQDPFAEQALPIDFQEFGQVASNLVLISTREALLCAERHQF